MAEDAVGWPGGSPKGRGVPRPLPRVASPAELTREDRDIVTLAQACFPLVRRPFAALGDAVGSSERAVLERLVALKEAGFVRKIGPVFEPDSLGLATELVAAEVDSAQLEAVGTAVGAWSPVTHCYAREHDVNLWFAAVAPDSDWLAEAAARVAGFAGVTGVWRLPALRRFKVAVQFDLSDVSGRVRVAEPAPDSASAARATTAVCAPPPTAVDPQLLAVAQTDLPICPDPFGRLASGRGVTAEDLLAALRRWVAEGSVRRYGALVNHTRLGFVANAMTVWHVPEERVEAVASYLTGFPDVSHCYQRPAFPRFPFNLYAMVHARSRPDCLAVVDELSSHCQDCERAVLFSTREFRKSAPDYARLVAARAGGGGDWWRG